MALFVAVLLTSNIASSAKIVAWGVALPVLGLPLAFDAGTLLFPISYIFGDVLTEVYGYAASRRVIWVGFAMAALMGVTLWLVARLPGEATWQQRDRAGGLRCRARRGQQGRHPGRQHPGVLLRRVHQFLHPRQDEDLDAGTLSLDAHHRLDAGGQAVDSVVFTVVACAFGVFPWSIALSIIAANYIFKVSIEVIFTPVTYRVISWLKRAEHEDYYDVGTDFNPFKVAV